MRGIADVQSPIFTRGRATTDLSQLLKLSRKKYWLLVAFNILFLIAGQTAGVLLSRFYYADGGSSMFMLTIVQTAGFPILCIPLILLPQPSEPPPPLDPQTKKYIALIYISLGVLLAGDNVLYSVGILYLSASTYSLISATQLVFNAVFSFFINSQKLTPLILNSVIVLSFSAALIAANEDSDTPAGVTKLEYAIGFLCTLGASAVYSLLLTLMQLTFQRVLKAETFGVVMKMQIYTSLVATVVSFGGLIASGQWRDVGREMENYVAGPASYIMTLVWTSIASQVCSVGVVGLIFLVSSLFSNVISIVALAVAPVASLIVFHDKMNGVKAIAMLQAIWGSASYLFQNYLDDSRTATPSQTPKPTGACEVSVSLSKDSCVVSVEEVKQ